MKRLNAVWKKITPTKALEQASGKLEILFFESVYRITYLVGISNSDHTALYSLYSNAVKLLMLLFVASEIWFFVSIEWTIDSIIDGVNIIIIQFSAIYKYKNMVIHEDIFKLLAASMETVNLDLSTHERKRKLNIWVSRNNSSFKLLFGIGTCTVIVWYLHPLFDDIEYNLHVAIRLPFNYETSARYTITYICVVIVFTYVSYFVMVNDLIVQAHLMSLLCQFNILEDSFRNIIKDCIVDINCNADVDSRQLLGDEFGQKYVSRLGNLVEQHKMILKNTLILRDVLSTPMLAHLAVSTTLLCSIGYQVAITIDVNFTKGLMSFLFLGYNMFVLYIICRWCEEVKFQSESIRDAVYCSGWESGITTVSGVRNCLLLILARTNKPVALSAGGMYDLSLASFSTMVRTSYSALTLLLRLRHN